MCSEIHSFSSVQLPSKFFSHTKLYVDPTTYNAVDEAVQDFATEIDRKDLNIGELLGGGEFAEVFKGTLFRNGMHKDVAIKTLKVIVFVYFYFPVLTASKLPLYSSKYVSIQIAWQ